MPVTRLEYQTPTRKRQCGNGLCIVADCPFQKVLSLQQGMFEDIAREQVAGGGIT